jgi:hypothetical protein
MTAPRNIPLIGLADRLTAPTDKETYAALLSYFDSLPADDDMLKLAQLLGFVTLIGSQLPGALNDLLKEIRAQEASAAEYHERIDTRLAKLPEEIAEGVDPEDLADALSESFRQQIAATGLQETAGLLQRSLGQLKGLSAELSTELKPILQQYRGLGETVSRDLTKLVAASTALQQHNSILVAQAREDSWLKQAFLCLALLLLGGVCGIVFEKGNTTDWISDLDSQVQRMQTLETETPKIEKPSVRKKSFP